MNSWDHYVDARNFATMCRILNLEWAIRHSLDITPPSNVTTVVNQAADSAVDRAVVEAVNVRGDDVPTLWDTWMSFE